MNNILTFEIVKHVMNSFGILKDSKTISIKNDSFELKEKLKFERDDGTIDKKRIWAAEISIQNEPLKVLVTDCSEKSDEEYYVFVKMHDCPAYCLYFNSNPEFMNFNIICVAVEKNWMKCNIGLQATFLAGIETVKDLPTTFQPSKKYKDDLDLFISFVDYNEEFNL